MTTSCCLNLPPPTSNKAQNASSLIPIKPPPQVSLGKTQGNWRRQCVLVGVASYCSIIGLELVNSSSLVGHEGIFAEEITMKMSTMTSNNPSSISLVGGGGAKWSQKRACPPWQGNSLETIVPENLPRPAARRRYEAVRSTSKTAPPLSAVDTAKLGIIDSCFSM